MRTYERSGVTVDQCAECRGIFLDRGELERLVDAENEFNGPRREEWRREDRRQEYRSDDDRRYGNQYQHEKKKNSFLENLFD
jgi:Zn-finger nucleic acid-binding protein